MHMRQKHRKLFVETTKPPSPTWQEMTLYGHIGNSFREQFFELKEEKLKNGKGQTMFPLMFYGIIKNFSTPRKRYSNKLTHFLWFFFREDIINVYMQEHVFTLKKQEELTKITETAYFFVSVNDSNCFVIDLTQYLSMFINS